MKKKIYICVMCNKEIFNRVKSDRLKYCRDCADKADKIQRKPKPKFNAFSEPIINYNAKECLDLLGQATSCIHTIKSELKRLKNVKRCTWRTLENKHYLEMKLNAVLKRRAAIKEHYWGLVYPRKYSKIITSYRR